MDRELTKSLSKLCKLYILESWHRFSILYDVHNLLLVDRKYSQEVEYFYYSEILYTLYIIKSINIRSKLTYYLYRNNMMEYDKMSYYRVIYTIST